MLEIMLGGGKAKSIQPPAQPPAFLYDPEQNIDLTNGLNPSINRRSGTTVNTSILIDGHPTINLAGSSQGITFTFPTPFDFGQANWTLEWSSLIAAIGTGYYSEMILSNAAFTQWLGTRWADGGYDNRLQISIGPWADNNSLWRGPKKNDVLGKTKHYALICKDNVVRFYMDGIQQSLMNGTGTTGATAMSFAKPSGLPAFNTLYVGWMNSTNVAYTGNLGRIRLSNYARYEGASYDLEPF